MTQRIVRLVVLLAILTAAVAACDRVVDLTQVPPDGFLPDAGVFPDGLALPDAAANLDGLPGHDASPPD